MTPRRLSWLAAACFVCLNSTANAQDVVEETGRVSGNGSVVIERLPDMMRMQVAVLAKDTSLEEAIQSLKDRVEAAKLELGKLGAEKDSIKVGSPTITSAKTDQQQQIEQMMRERMKRAGRKQPEKSNEVPITIAATISAHWKLTATTPEELLVATHPLQAKIKQADLAGAKEATEPSPEEEEALEEMQGNFGYSSDNEPKPGEPIFTFVSNISDEEYDKALAEGFQKAKADATRLAKVTDLKLGRLQGINVNSASEGADQMADYQYARWYGAMQRGMTQAESTDDAREATGTQFGNVRYRVMVVASFHLSPGE